ncbi:MAG: tetratricopeptide repeat protein [Hyphomicrobiaceae bacterium]
MSDDSEALIREIDEEIRRERLVKLWNQYGTLFLGGLAAIVLLVGGWQWYTAYQLDRSQTAGSQFQEAVQLLDGDKKQDGLAALEQIAKEGTPAYAMLAKLRLAAVHREAGEADKALALYQVVADDTGGDRLLSSFASLQIASLKVDSGTWTDVQNRLNELADDSSPWRHTARELLGLAAFRHKKWDEARQAFTSLMSDPTVSQTIRQRAQTALALITRETETKNPGKASQAAPAKTDLKKDKSAEEGAKSTGGSNASAASTPSNGAGAKDDASKSK